MCIILGFARRRTLRIHVPAASQSSLLANEVMASTCLYIFYEIREIAAMTRAKGIPVETK